jgi:alkaline phosphatase
MNGLFHRRDAETQRRQDKRPRGSSSPFSAPPRLCGEVLAVALLVGCSDVGAAPQETPDAPKSVILLIGDGMGPQAVGLLMDWADAAKKSPTNFERLANEGVNGWLRTAPAGGPLTDSAAAATALACGVSTNNGQISTDPEGKPLATCLEDARARGRRTGLVTTTEIQDATPACFAAHVTFRGEKKDISKQYVQDGLGADVMLGGGRRCFSETLLAEAAAKGWPVVGSSEELAALPASATKALGLFADAVLPFVLDRDQPGEAKAPTLPEMAKKALEIVSRGDSGFFLMIEGGRIDHAGHGNDAAALLAEMREFDEAIGLALAFRTEHPDTLVVVTSDHETGGLSVTSGDAMNALKPGDFLAMAKVESSVMAMLPDRPPPDFALSKFGVGHEAFYAPHRWFCVPSLERSATFHVTFSTSGHTTTPVPIAAVGPGASAFAGVHRNTLVGRKLREWMSK